MTSVTISTIRNSCIVNNANIAVQNKNITPLDAINNWWGMPTGATHDNIPSGDAVGQNIFHAPHLPTMPFLCDLTSADWIPFSEQELQHALNSHIPYLGGIAFALIDFEWGRGAKFDIVTHPNYGNLHDVAYISIQPNPTGDLITLQLDITRLPTDETVRQIVTCELMPLFVNSLQQVQNRYVSPSQNIASMVVMERDLMMRFTPPTEITPEPTPEFVLNYDASCLPNLTALPTPTPSPTPPQNEDESGMLVTITPLEGEFSLLETGTMQESQSTPIFLDVDTTLDDGFLSACDPNTANDCSLRGAITQARNNPTQEYAILIPNGTYRLTQTIIIEGKVSLIGLEAYTGSQFAGAVITQDGTVLNTLITIRNINSNQKSIAYLYNLNIRGGRGYSSSMLNIHGSDVYIYDSRFEDNDANGYGGAIKVNDLFAPTSFVEIKNTVFEDNEAYMGGAILGEQGIGSIRLECVTFKNNHAGLGGAIATYYSYAPFQFNGTISIDNSNFITNTSNNGGAIHRQGGSIVIGDNHWSPNANATPTASNSVVGMPVPTLDKQIDNEFLLDCEIDEPPRKVAIGFCEGTVTSSTSFRLRETPDGTIINFNAGTIIPVYILGKSRGNISGTWYYFVEYYTSSAGWQRDWVSRSILDLSRCNNGDYVPLLYGDMNGTPWTGMSPYDYILPPPPSGETWLNDSNCTGDGTQADLEACARVVYFVYYKMFEQIYHRPPRVSDVLISVYQLELLGTSLSGISGYNGDSAYNLTVQALGQNYWIVCGDGANYGYPNCLFQLDPSDPTDFVTRYLHQIQAWYGKGRSLKEWYERYRSEIRNYQSIADLQIMIANVANLTPSDQNEWLAFNGFANLVSLLPDEEYKVEATLALNQGKIQNSSIPWHWGNYAHGKIGYVSMRTDSRTVFCVWNRSFRDDNRDSIANIGDFWTDDIFVLVTDQVGGTSVSTPNPNNLPSWIAEVWNKGLPTNYSRPSECSTIPEANNVLDS